jgi:hypothetical protein
MSLVALPCSHLPHEPKKSPVSKYPACPGIQGNNTHPSVSRPKSFAVPQRISILFNQEAESLVFLGPRHNAADNSLNSAGGTWLSGRFWTLWASISKRLVVFPKLLKERLCFTDVGMLTRGQLRITRREYHDIIPGKNIIALDQSSPVRHSSQWD